MGRLSRRSNPTNLTEIDKNRITIAIVDINGQKHFMLQRVDLQDLGLSLDLQLICIARTGNSSRRFDLGTLGSWNKSPQSLDALDQSGALRFRILVHSQNDPQLKASAENLRPFDDAQAESLIPMEPAQLGELLWQLDISGDDGPVLKYNVAVFPSAAGVENYLPFAALVLPEAVRHVMQKIANDPAVLDDPGDPLSAWNAWLEAMGVGKPPSSGDDKESAEWCDQIVDAFCRRHLFASRLRIDLTTGATA